MLKRKLAFLIIMFGFISTSAQAHSGGHGEIVLNESQAISVAHSVATQFITQDPGLGFGKLDPSWKTLPAAAMRIHRKQDDYYIVSLTNKDKTLFILISIFGDVYDANFTGEFEGLK